MAIPDRIAKNRVNLDSNEPGRVDRDVVAPTNVRARQTDPSKTIDAMNRWVGVQAEQADKDREKALALAQAEGYRAAALNKVDEARLTDDSLEAKAYDKGVTELRTEAHGLRFLSQSREELQRAAAEPGFDFDTWREAKFEEFYEQSGITQNPDGLPIANRFVAQFEQNMQAQYSAIASRAKLAALNDSLADNLSEMLNAGVTKPAQLAQWRASRADGKGLEPHEVEDLMGSVILDKLASGDMNAYALAESAGLMKDHQWSSRFNEQKRSTETRLERERIDALEADAKRTMQVRQRLGTLADRGQLTIVQLAKLEENGEITPNERNWAWNQQLNADAKRLEDSRKAYEQSVADEHIDRLSRSGQEMILRETAGDPKTRRRVRDAMDQQYADGLTAALSDDPGMKEAGVHEMSRVIDQAQQNAMPLDYLKSTFDEADVGVPKRFERMGNLYRELVAQGRGDYLRNNISTTAYARMERFRFLVENGSSTQEAVSKIADSPVKIEDATQQANFNGRLIQDQAERLGKDMGVPPGLILPKLRQYAIEQYSFGAGGEAVTQASEMLKGKYVAVGGSVVPRHWFPENNPQEPEEFNTAWDDIKESVVIPKLREKYGDDIDDVELLPDPNVPGQFLMRLPGEAALIPDASVSSESVRRAYLTRKRDAAAAHHRANQEFAERELPPL